MGFLHFALNNVLRDKESYVAFWLSSVFCIVVFFVFSANMNHPQLAQSVTIQEIMRYALVFIGIYSFGFLALSLGAFLKRKHRLYGALLTMGMSRRQAGLSIVLESCLIGASALVAGLAIGLVFGHLMIMIMARIIRIADVAYQFPLASIVQTSATFVAVFLLASAVQARGVLKRPIVELLAAKADESRGMRFSKPLAILGVLLLACGCFGCLFGFFPAFSELLQSRDSLAQSYPWLVLGLIVIGLFLTYRQFSFLAISWAMRSRYYLAEGNAIWISSLRDRLKGSVMAIFAATFMLMMSFCAIIVFMALITSVRADITKDIPYAVGYFSYGDNSREASDLETIRARLDEGGVAYEESSYEVLQAEKTVYGRKFISRSAYEQQTGEALSIQDGQAIDLSGSFSPDEGGARVEGAGGVSFVVTGAAVPLLDDVKRPESYVVTDADWQRLADAGELVSMRVFIFDADDEAQADEVRESCLVIRDELGFGLSDGNDFLFIPRIESIFLQEYGYQIDTYVAFMLAAIFIVSSISLIYFRLLNDVRESLPVMRNLNRMGLSVAQVLRIQKRQLQLLFSLPVAFAVVLTGFVMAFLVSMDVASTHIFVRMAATMAPLLALEAGLFAALNARFSTQVRNHLRPQD